MNDKELLEAIRTIVREEVERFHLKYEVRKDFDGNKYLHSLEADADYRRLSQGLPIQR